MSVFTMFTRGSHLSTSVSIRKKEKEKEGKRGGKERRGKEKRKGIQIGKEEVKLYMQMA